MSSEVNEDNRSRTGNGTAEPVARSSAAASGLAPWAWRPVLVIAGLLAVVLLLVSGNYGYFVDELYFIVAGDHPSWGYADQPWLLPLLAHALDSIWPDSLTWLRLPAALVSAAGVLTTVGLARELGGGRRAQILAAAVHAGSFGTLWTGHLLATSTFDPPLWTGICWLVVRWIRLERARTTDRRHDRLLLGAAVLTAVSLQIKYLVPALWAAILLGVLFLGPRALLRRPMLWIGLVLAAATALPSLLWQAGHGWPQLAMSDVIAAENGGTVGRIMFGPLALFWAGALTGAAMAVHGLIVLCRRPAFAPYRFLAVAVLLPLIAFALTAGRPYYAAEVFGPLWAASAVAVTELTAARWWRWLTSRPVLILSALIGILAALPVLPRDATDPNDRFLTKPGTTGWSELADTVAATAPALPGDTVVITSFYPQAAALEHYRDGRFAFPVLSGSRGYWFLGAPPPDADNVLYVGPVPESLRRGFARAQQLTTYQNPHGIPWVNGTLPLTLLSGRTESWDALWDSQRELGPAGE
ncbi:ArnT family glycosyltransferase [Amycolatopsis anabasis]|uniref:ArnT family glycosyltransferase n=1 Tax=Amycolatopsis anabasis TaxID=1840409 RepID=UPI00131C5A40|nr:glycosyltransferase family 39 protein [Amycolatopsis anabasis]